MSATTTVFGPLRAASRAVTGQSKDWVAVALPDRLVIGYGRTGHALRCTVVPQARCQQQDPQLEGQRRQHDKQAEGYQIVSGAPDPWVVAFLKQAGGVPAPAPAILEKAEPPTDSDGLWWELLPTADLGPTLRATVNDVEPALATHLQMGLKVGGIFEPGLQLEVDGERLILPLKPPARNGGCAQSLGAQTVLLLLHQRLPAGTLRLTDAHGNLLTPTDFLKTAGWLQDSDLRALAETLGLTLEPAVFAGLGSPRWFI